MTRNYRAGAANPSIDAQRIFLLGLIYLRIYLFCGIKCAPTGEQEPYNSVERGWIIKKTCHWEDMSWRVSFSLSRPMARSTESRSGRRHGSGVERERPNPRPLAE